MPFQPYFLTPVLALVVWTLIMLIWMYAGRLPAFARAGIDPNDARHPDAGYNAKIPANVRAAADNYNHLHEQPTIFYALMFFAALTGGGDKIMFWLGCAYVIVRIVHSFVQVLSPQVAQRFVLFMLGSAILVVMAAKEVIRILTSGALTL